MTGSANLGDATSHWLYSGLSEKELTKVNAKNEDISYLAAGSILRLCKKNHIVMGTGFISDGDDLGKGGWGGPYNGVVFQKPLKILSVRGPKTRNKLMSMGVDCPETYGDPLLVSPLIYDKEMKIEYDIGIIPHYVDKKTEHFLLLKDRLSKKYKVNYINIMSGSSPEHFVNELKKCEYIISSTLHGVMLGLAYGKKTIFTEFSNRVVGKKFKFYDFFESINVNYYNVLAFDNSNLLKNEIKIDKQGLINTGADIINVCPIIEPPRKRNLTAQWQQHVNTILENKT